MSLSYPRSGFFSRSLRTKVTLSIVVPLTLILGAFTLVENARHREAVLANLSFLASQTGQVIENSLEHDMLARNPAGIQEILDSISEENEIRVVYLLDTSGRVVFAPDQQDVGARLDNRDPTCQPCHRLPASERPSSVVVTLAGGERVFRSMNPIENQPACQGCHGRSQRLTGLLLTDLSMAPLEEPLAADLRENLLWWGSILLATVAVVNLVMSRQVIQRLEGLSGAFARFGQGRLDLRLPTEEPDEIGQLASAFNQMGQRLEAEAAENRALSEGLRRQSAQRGELLKRLITAQEDERKRVARELHDELGQTLSGLALRAEMTERFVTSEPNRALDQLRQTRRLIDEVSGRMYDLINALRPSTLDDLGLVAALKAQAERLFADSGIAFELETAGLNGRLPPEIETSLYRIFQEALSNVVRHARASRVRIRLAARDGVFEGQISDDGQGFNPEALGRGNGAPGGWGLLGMRERVAQCSGQLEISTRPGGGTRLTVRIPLTEQDCG